MDKLYVLEYFTTKYPFYSFHGKLITKRIFKLKFGVILVVFTPRAISFACAGGQRWDSKQVIQYKTVSPGFIIGQKTLKGSVISQRMKD